MFLKLIQCLTLCMGSTKGKIVKLKEMTSHDLDFRDFQLALLHTLKKIIYYFHFSLFKVLLFIVNSNSTFDFSHHRKNISIIINNRNYTRS